MKCKASFEEQVFDCFKKNAGVEGFFENNFGLALGKNCRILYNYFNGFRELDIVVRGYKRLNIGLLVCEDYNIEVQSELCTLGDINHKCSDGYLYSILSRNASNNSKSSNKVYSFVNFENPGFSPAFIDYSCDFCLNKIGEKNIQSLEGIIRSKINPALKSGILYYLCDNIMGGNIKGLCFIPSLMQVSAYSGSSRFNLVIDSGIKHPESFSQSYENYIRKNFGKKLSKSMGLKDFKIATLNEDIALNSEINEAIIFNKESSINDYINKIINC
jgi:hypothetical protein